MTKATTPAPARSRPGPLAVPHLRAWIDALTKTRDSDRRRALREAMRNEGAAVAPALAACLDHPDALTRWELINLLGEFADPRTLEAVLEFALTEDEVHARWRAFWALCRQPRDDLAPRLLRELRGRNATRRWRAALVLSMLRRSEAAPVLRAGLDAGDAWTQWEALSALKALKDVAAEAAIARFLEPERPMAQRQEATLALGAIGTPSALARLVQALDDAEPQVRWRASMGLAHSAEPAHRAALRRARQRETDPAVRAQFERDIAALGE